MARSATRFYTVVLALNGGGIEDHILCSKEEVEEFLQDVARDESLDEEDLYDRVRVFEGKPLGMTVTHTIEVKLD